MDELEEIRRRSDLSLPGDDTSADAYDALYETDPGEIRVFDKRLRRIVALILLIGVLFLTWRWITFSFIAPTGPDPAQGTRVNPLT